MTESAVVTHLARTCGMSKSQVKHVLADLATLAARELKANSEFTIPALGKLIVARRRNYGIRSASFNTIEFRLGNRLKLSFALRKPII